MLLVTAILNSVAAPLIFFLHSSSLELYPSLLFVLCMTLEPIVHYRTLTLTYPSASLQLQQKQRMVGPAWLRVLLGEKFFESCRVHQSVKKNEKNIFCLNCCITICTHCLPLHRCHQRLQIRRYVYHDVIRLSDAQKFMNCSLVQPYTTNRAKVVFLKNRPISRPIRGSANFCINCDRSLQEHFLFCSLACKVHHLLTTKNGGKDRAESFKELGDGEMTPDSVLESPDSLRTWSGTSTSVSNGGAFSCKAHFCAATTELVRKGRSSCAPMPPLLSCSHSYSPVAETVGRRKGVPRRSPLN